MNKIWKSLMRLLLNVACLLLVLMINYLLGRMDRVGNDWIEFLSMVNGQVHTSYHMFLIWQEIDRITPHYLLNAVRNRGGS